MVFSMNSESDELFIFSPVLRVWDVLLFQGNRVMLFRTALALMELYGTVIRA